MNIERTTWIMATDRGAAGVACIGSHAMTVAKSRNCWAMSLAVGVALVCCSGSNLHAQLLLSDDFSDRNDEGWTHFDALTQGGPAIFDASSGEYVISSTGEVPALPPDQASGVASFWEQSKSDPRFSHGVVRAKVRFGSDISGVELFMRASWNNSGLTGGYAFFANNQYNSVGVGGVGVGEAPGAIDFDLNETDEYIIQGTLIENKQSMKIWKVGEEEPTAPQVSWVDDGYTYDSGSVGLITYFGHNNPSGRHLSVSFDDVAFTAREPATILVQPSPEYLIRDTSSDGKGDDVLSGTPLFNVGELDSPSANYVGRSISKFALPNYPRASAH